MKRAGVLFSPIGSLTDPMRDMKASAVSFYEDAAGEKTALFSAAFYTVPVTTSVPLPGVTDQTPVTGSCV